MTKTFKKSALLEMLKAANKEAHANPGTSQAVVLWPNGVCMTADTDCSWHGVPVLKSYAYCSLADLIKIGEDARAVKSLLRFCNEEDLHFLDIKKEEERKWNREWLEDISCILCEEMRERAALTVDTVDDDDIIRIFQKNEELRHVYEAAQGGTLNDPISTDYTADLAEAIANFDRDYWEVQDNGDTIIITKIEDED